MKIKERNSNFELLRIVAMFMIIIYHIFIHSIYIELNSGTNLLFNNPIFYKKLIILDLISPFGQIGNIIFIMISGYFLVSKKEINLIKISKKLLLEQLFAMIILIVSSTIIYKNYNVIFNESIFNINYFNSCSWFVGYYFIVIVLSKLFINKYLNNFNKNKYLVFLLVIFGITQFSWTIGLFNGISSVLNILLTGIFAYSLGGYIKKYNPFKNIKIWVLIFILIICMLFIIQSNYNVYLFDMKNYVGGIFTQNIVRYTDYNLMPIMVGIIIFELFRRIKMSNNKVINFIGASTFMIYLIHDNELFYGIWQIKDWITLLYNNPINFLLVYILWAIVTFIIGLLCYLLYLLFEKIFNKYQYLFIKK